MQDRELLHLFIASASQDAFAQIVHRHMDAVYASARRQVRDPQLAEDIAQAVFIVLARKAAKLQDRDSLAGWLMKTTHLASRDAIKMNSRRKRYEQHAASLAQLAQSRLEQNMTPQWEEISPQLDQAMAQLNETDRSALTLRYLQGHSTAETALTLGVSEQAAAKRISRGVDRLRRFLIRQKAIAPATSLAIVLDQIPKVPAPATLAHGVTIAATAGSATPAGLAIANGVIHMMTWSKIVAAALMIAALASATGLGIGTVKLLADDTNSPAAAATPTPAPQSPPDQPATTIARLSNGVSLEIVGVNESPAKGKQWWHPNGDPLTTPPYSRMNFYMQSSPADFNREIAVTTKTSVQGAADPASLHWYILDSHGNSSSNITDVNGLDVRDIEAEAFALPRTSKTATLHAIVAAGPWTSLIKAQGTGQLAQGGKNSFLFSSVFEKNGDTHILVGCIGKGNDDLRLVAIDRTGNRIPARQATGVSTTSDSMSEYTVHIPAASIKQWELQSRPFNQWIEIQNISLNRNQPTTVNITTSDNKAP